MLLLGLAACGGPRPLDEVPEHLLGTWKTEGSRYSNRFLEVGPQQLVLGVKNLELDRFDIEAIDVSVEGDVPVYRLHYTADEGYEDFLALAYHDLEPPALYVGEIPFQWRRVKTR